MARFQKIPANIFVWLYLGRSVIPVQRNPKILLYLRSLISCPHLESILQDSELAWLPDGWIPSPSSPCRPRNIMETFYFLIKVNDLLRQNPRVAPGKVQLRYQNVWYSKPRMSMLRNKLTHTHPEEGNQLGEMSRGQGQWAPSIRRVLKWKREQNSSDLFQWDQQAEGLGRQI